MGASLSGALVSVVSVLLALARRVLVSRHLYSRGNRLSSTQSTYVYVCGLLHRTPKVYCYFVTKKSSTAKKRTIKLTAEAKHLLSALGRVGGQTRAQNMSSEERRAGAIKASKAAAKARTAKATERQKKAK